MHGPGSQQQWMDGAQARGSAAVPVSEQTRCRHGRAEGQETAGSGRPTTRQRRTWRSTERLERFHFGQLRPREFAPCMGRIYMGRISSRPTPLVFSCDDENSLPILLGHAVPGPRVTAVASVRFRSGPGSRRRSVDTTRTRVRSAHAQPVHSLKPS